MTQSHQTKKQVQRQTSPLSQREKSEREAMEEILNKQISRQLQPIRLTPPRQLIPKFKEDYSQF